MDIESFLRSATSLIAALGGLLASIATIVKAIKDSRELHSPPPPAERRSPPSLLITILRMPLFDLGVLLMLLSVSIFVARALLPPLPLNVQLTSAAWGALNKADYAMAVTKARECIDTFEGQAIREQEALMASGSPPPPIGAVSDGEKRLILSRGALNDVATCYFIMGQALEKQNRISGAKEAYAGAQKFPYARTWDPRRWFWSPADLAADRLAQLP